MLQLDKFDNPVSCREYKEYSRKWLPQNLTLEGYEVDDFKVDPQSSQDMFDQVSNYIRTLEPYTKHLTMAAHLRQKHYDEYISGQYIECAEHAYWRIGLNRVAEDARNKLAYWTNFKDQLFSDLIKKDEARRIIENKRTWADVDFSIKNVDYNSKVISKDIVRQPKITESEKRKIRAARKKEEEEYKLAAKRMREQENKFLDEMITGSTKMRELMKKEFVTNGGILATELITELKSDNPYSSTVFRRARSYHKRKPGQHVLIDFETAEHLYELARLYFSMRHHHKGSILVDLTYMFYYKEFRKAYIEVSYKEMKYTNETKEGIIMLVRSIDNGEFDELRKYFSQKFARNVEARHDMKNYLDLLHGTRHTAILYERLTYLKELIDAFNKPDSEDIVTNNEDNKDEDNKDEDNKDEDNKDEDNKDEDNDELNDDDTCDEYYSEELYDFIDFSNFQERLCQLSELEQVIYVDREISLKFNIARRIVCQFLKLDEKIYIEKDKNTKKAERCRDPSCRACNQICYCKKCHNKFIEISSDSD